MEPILSAGDIVITRTSAKIGETTYQIANIGSVFLKREALFDRTTQFACSIVFFIAFIVFLIDGSELLTITAVLLFLVSITVLYFNPSMEKMTVTFKTSSGDIEALVTHDAELALRIKGAIEAAFAQRL